MMAINTLRIDSGDGSRVVDYRIEDGSVETRVTEVAAEDRIEQEWRQLTPEELSAHVMAGTVLAHWLRRKLGIFRLMRACTPDYSSTQNCEEGRPHRAVA